MLSRVLSKKGLPFQTLINIMSLSTYMFDRIGIYFFIFGVAAIPKVLLKIENGKRKSVMVVFVLMATAIYFARMYLFIDESSYIYYRSIFSR